MKFDLKKLLISLVAAAALNTGCVLFIEYVIKSVDAEVITSTVICLLWMIFAALFCRKTTNTENKEN